MLWRLLRPRPAPARRAAEHSRPREEFHAVEIVSSGIACEAARALTDVRFLSREGPPRLPLADCSFPATCRCRYQHHADRRRDVRRNSDHAWGPNERLPPDRERRRSPGRRATDRRRGD